MVTDGDLNALVRLTAQAVPLEPIVVTVFSRRLERAGFYERQKRGMGKFIDRRAIDALRAQFAVDLLRSVPEIRTLARRNARNETTPRGTVGRNNCRFRYLLDGTRLLPDFELDNISPHVIEGLEIYLGMAAVPADFRAYAADPNSATCGVIVIWLRSS